MKKTSFVGILISTMLLMVFWIPIIAVHEESVNEPVAIELTVADLHKMLSRVIHRLHKVLAKVTANRPIFDSTYQTGTVSERSWNAGETLTVTVLPGLSSLKFFIDVEGAFVASGYSPGTLTYTFPTTGFLY